MRTNDWLSTAQAALTDAGIDTARLDALVLLENATGIDRAQLLAHPETTLTPIALEQLADQLERRLQHEPLAYILGRAEFYGRSFAVTPDVLVPRPESETIIDVLKQQLPLAGHTPANTKIADIGTGSGALAITAALETGVIACAVDIDEACLTVAKNNAVVHTTPLLTLQGDLLSPFLAADASAEATAFGAPDILLANLPYVPVDYPINNAARHEPALALFAGTDGLDAYRRFFAQVVQLPKQPVLIITESLPEQHAALAALATDAGYHQIIANDFIQAFSPF